MGDELNMIKRWPECVIWGEEVEVEVRKPSPLSCVGVEIYGSQDPEVKDVNYNLIYEIKDGPVKETHKVKTWYRIVRVGKRDTTKVSKDQVIKYLEEAGQNFVMVVCEPVEIKRKRQSEGSAAMAEQAVTKTALEGSSNDTGKKKAAANASSDRAPGTAVASTSDNEDDDVNSPMLYSEPNQVADTETAPPCSGYMIIDDIPGPILTKICMKVSGASVMGGTRDMAYAMGFSVSDTDFMLSLRIELPCKHIIQQWGRKEKVDGKLPTVADLSKIFHSIGRDDIVSILGTEIPCPATEHIISHSKK